MARNYQIGEAVEIIAEGTDIEAIQDLGRRYPLLVAKVAKATSGFNAKEVVELFGCMPEYLSANKVNKAIKVAVGLADGGTTTDDVDGDAEDEKPVEKVSTKKATTKTKKEGSDDPYAGKDAIELFKECKKRGIKAAAKKTVRYYVGLLKSADDEAEDAEADDWSEEEETSKKAPAKKGKAKKAEPEPDNGDEDDDDWDI